MVNQLMLWLIKQHKPFVRLMQLLQLPVWRCGFDHFNWTRDNTVDVAEELLISGNGDISGLNQYSKCSHNCGFHYHNSQFVLERLLPATVLMHPTPNAVADQTFHVCLRLMQLLQLSGDVASTTFDWTRDNTVTDCRWHWQGTSAEA
jgi:hypothetical protein